MGAIATEVVEASAACETCGDDALIARLRDRKAAARTALLARVRPLLLQVESLLDLGSGVVPFQHLLPRYHVCCDIHDEYLRRFHERASVFQRDYYDKVHACGGRFGLLRGNIVELPFGERSFDTVAAGDVIEHLTHDDGLRMLDEAERVARRQVIVATPLGYYPQVHVEGRADRWGLGGGYWQAHRSAWRPEEFERRGYDVLVEEEVHFEDGYGHVFDRPIGMFWAVKTLGDDATESVAGDRQGGQV